MDTYKSDNLQSLDLSLSPDIYLNGEEKVRASFQKGGKLKKKRSQKPNIICKRKVLF